MRILQLIDSLEAGGAERMAVNYANAFAGKIPFSALVATRKEGALKCQLHDDVAYFFLKRKTTFDIRALLRLRRFVKVNRVDLIQAHASSFLLAVLLKLIYPKIKIIWHDHNGNRVLNNQLDNRVIKWASYFFSGIIVVNLELQAWAINNLKVKKVIYVPNFTTIGTNEQKLTFLKGNEGKRMVCLANLRIPKNHITLLKAFMASDALKEGFTLHLIGKDNEDNYSDELKKFITAHKLENQVYIYGSCPDVFHILLQADIGVLCSTFEGFPVTLLEYGLSRLAVISTNVGYCAEIIKDRERGLLISPTEVQSISEAITKTVNDKSFRAEMANNLNEYILDNYSEESILKKVTEFYARLA